MKRGQLLSQPFFYIFLIVVSALVLVFGYMMINRLLNTECQVEGKVFISDLRKNVEEVYSLGFEGTSKECAIVERYGKSGLKCEIVKPKGLKGLCFVDISGDFDINKITIKELKDELQEIKGQKDVNLFFLNSNDKCGLNSEKISKLEIPEPICLNSAKPMKFILENKGRKVVIKKA